MAKHGNRRKAQMALQQNLPSARAAVPVVAIARPPFQPEKLEKLPVSSQQIRDLFERLGEASPFALRRETMLRIERLTGVPLICYVTRTSNVQAPVLAQLDDSDLVGFDDLIGSVEGRAIDICIVSNGGSAETTERIVRMLRHRFDHIRYILPANAFSAATLLSFSGDEILMSAPASLGPIDPQINGIPARAILRAFENLEERLKREGPAALTAYVPLLNKYDLSLLEMCKSHMELSKELARAWISGYMLRCDPADPKVSQIVEFFSDYDVHKSHGRSIDRVRARELNLNVKDVESLPGLGDLVRSLYNQYVMWFESTSFYKCYEDSRGNNWGRQMQQIIMQPGIFPGPVHQPGPPKPT